MTAPDSILRLVDQFQTHLVTYKSINYNETQVRREFVDPFFEALGWDVFNKQGYAHAYKDVIHEDAIKVAGKSQAPDYAFRIGGTRKFFVEAKKPAVNLKEDISPAYQLRRYAWSAKLPLSILTDFEEFSVYDCRTKPALVDKPSVGRIKMLTFRDYPDHWDEIASVFSREAILKGSFDKYAESSTGKHGTAEVDDAFLAEIERWRDLLARNIALRNPALSQHDLNYAVQMTIDRLIFLRICEDRGIEFYGQLQGLLKGGEIYPRLCQLFHQADTRYNSGLFHFHAEKGRPNPDELSLRLEIDDFGVRRNGRPFLRRAEAILPPGYNKAAGLAEVIPVEVNSIAFDFPDKNNLDAFTASVTGQVLVAQLAAQLPFTPIVHIGPTSEIDDPVNPTGDVLSFDPATNGQFTFEIDVASLSAGEIRPRNVGPITLGFDDFDFGGVVLEGLITLGGYQDGEFVGDVSGRAEIVATNGPSQVGAAVTRGSHWSGGGVQCLYLSRQMVVNLDLLADGVVGAKERGPGSVPTHGAPLEM